MEMLFKHPTIRDECLGHKVVHILGTHFPVQVTVLRSLLKKHFETSVSYQAIHKKLQELERRGIVVREENAYLLSLEWVQNMQFFTEHVTMRYNNKGKPSVSELKKLTKEGDMITLDFGTLSDVDDFCIGMIDYFLKALGPQDKIVYSIGHSWWPLLYSKKQLEIHPGEKERIFCIHTGNTSLDKWCILFEQNLGSQVLYNSEFAHMPWFHIYGDVIVQFFIDSAILKKIDHLFCSAESADELNLRELIRVLNTLGCTRVVLHKNKMMADQLREKVLSCFS